MTPPQQPPGQDHQSESQGAREERIEDRRLEVQLGARDRDGGRQIDDDELGGESAQDHVAQDAGADQDAVDRAGPEDVGDERPATG